MSALLSEGRCQACGKGKTAEPDATVQSRAVQLLDVCEAQLQILEPPLETSVEVRLVSGPSLRHQTSRNRVDKGPRPICLASVAEQGVFDKC